MTKFPINFPVSREVAPETGSISDLVVSHAVLLFWRVGRLTGKLPTFRALAHDYSVSGAN